jgi:hypothetical protein
VKYQFFTKIYRKNQLQKKEKRKKIFVPPLMSDVRQESFLDDDTLQRLDERSRLLYNMIMAQFTDMPNFQTALSELFDHKSNASELFNHRVVHKTDIIDLFKDDWLNVSILQIFCM